MSRSLVPVSVLVVTWNSADVLAASLSALAGSDPRPAELVVVDNASTDHSVAMVEAFAERSPFPVNLIKQDRNTGFAAAMNRAIANAAEPNVLVLNPDVRVEPDMIGRLHAGLDQAGTTTYAVGPKLRRASGNSLVPTDVIDSAGIRMTRDGRHFDRGSGEQDVGQFDRPAEVFGLTGAAALFRKAALEGGKIDGEVFDEDFFAYREDADLAWRMQGFGFRAWFEPTAVGYHLRRATPENRKSLPPEINRHSVKNRFLLRIHHADRGWLVQFGPTSVARDMVVIGACLTVERSSLGGLLWVIRNARRHLRRRQEILTRRRVRSEDLRRWF